MKKNIEDWWMGYNLPISEVIRIGIRDNPQLTKPAIQAACEAVYKENNPKLVLFRYQLAWTAWRYARVIESSEKRAIYVQKYEADRKDLVKLKAKKIKYERIRQVNIYDLSMFHGPYWIMILSILTLIYSLGT